MEEVCHKLSNRKNWVNRRCWVDQNSKAKLYAKVNWYSLVSVEKNSYTKGNDSIENIQSNILWQGKEQKIKASIHSLIHIHRFNPSHMFIQKQPSHSESFKSASNSTDTLDGTVCDGIVWQNSLWRNSLSYKER